MAFSKIQYNKTLEHGRALHEALAKIEDGIDDLKRIEGAIIRMIDGDGSQASHFGEVVTRLGVEGADANDALARAKSLKDEVSSFLGKLTTDGQVTFVDAARRQLMDILR